MSSSLFAVHWCHVCQCHVEDLLWCALLSCQLKPVNCAPCLQCVSHCQASSHLPSPALGGFLFGTSRWRCRCLENCWGPISEGMCLCVFPLICQRRERKWDSAVIIQKCERAERKIDGKWNRERLKRKSATEREKNWKNKKHAILGGMPNFCNGLGNQQAEIWRHNSIIQLTQMDYLCLRLLECLCACACACVRLWPDRAHC